MTDRKAADIVVAIGASAGGVEALIELLSEVPPDLNAPVVIAVHSDPKSQLTEVLKRHCDLNLQKLSDGQKLEKGVVYVVPGATHGFFRAGTIRLSEPARASSFRPSIDSLFITLASEYGAGAIAVVLSGTMDDGVRGAQVIFDMGGRTLVQNPEDARFGSMPMNVIRADHPREILSAQELGQWLRETIGTFSQD